MTEALQNVLDAARTLPPAELPELIGKLAEAQAICQQRMFAPVQNVREPEDDRWLSIEEAMQLLGFSKSYLYTRDFPFKRKEGRAIRFSKSGILQYISQKRRS